MLQEGIWLKVECYFVVFQIPRRNKDKDNFGNERSEARRRRLGPREARPKLSIPFFRDGRTEGGAGGGSPPRYGTSCYRVGLGFTDINTSCKPPSRDKSHVVNPGVCNLTRYSEVLLAGARGFSLSFVWRGFPR